MITGCAECGISWRQRSRARGGQGLSRMLGSWGPFCNPGLASQGHWWMLLGGFGLESSSLGDKSGPGIPPVTSCPGALAGCEAVIVCGICFCFALFAGRGAHGEKGQQVCPSAWDGAVSLPAWVTWILVPLPGEQRRDPRPAPLPTADDFGWKKMKGRRLTVGRRQKCLFVLTTCWTHGTV